MGEQKRVPKKSTIIKDAIALFIITLIAGLSLGLVNQITKETHCCIGACSKKCGLSESIFGRKSF